ncbi:sugar ABC transporter substrate-binding protein [Roseibium sp. Sym1]|uniref:sugar ABC transporter substrate-binding protein n=1 Tax=Roseibium sp. Sym1 TaxID=3016006 RepID=UPI0022B2C0A3|nr:sugar ABC transporter substrate-binding protein [Roseibium sp. Sym1]
MIRSAMTLACTVSMSILAAQAAAEDFHGFDPQAFDGKRLPAEAMQEMVSEAAGVTAPRNGDKYVFGFANLQRDIAFGVLVENGIVENAEAAGIELVIADNRLDGPTALSNANSFTQRDVDYVIEFQTDANFGQQIMQVFDNAGIAVTAIDIPMPGANFFGVNNPKSGFMGGSYLATAAKEQFGERLNEGYLVIGALPQSGAIPRMRTDGQRAGFMALSEGFPEENVIEIDTKNTLQEAYTQMSNVLGRIPPGAPIMIIAINDQATIGMLQAVRAAGRAETAIAVGNGADEAEALATDPKLVAATGSFPGDYGNYLIPLALSSLAGKDVPDAMFVTHQMVTKGNICEFYSEYDCQEGAGIDYAFPQEEFDAYLGDLKTQDWLKGYESILPES